MKIDPLTIEDDEYKAVPKPGRPVSHKSKNKTYSIWGENLEWVNLNKSLGVNILIRRYRLGKDLLTGE